MISFFSQLGVVFSALLYIHPVSHVFSNWIEQTKTVKTLHIKQETTVFDSSYPNGSAVVEEEIWIKRPTYFRKSSRFPRGKVEHLMTPNRSVKISNGQIDNVTPFEAYGPIGLFYMPDGSKRLSLLLSQLGFSTESPAWFLRGKSEVLYQLGVAPTQIFFMKDDWTPAGVNYKSKEYELHTSKTKFPIPFPDTWEVKTDGKVIEQTKVLSVQTNISLSDSVFDLNLLRSGTVSK